MKILGVILGILMTIGGGYCVVAPDVTFKSLLIVLAIVMMESAIANLILWIEIKKAGGKNGWLIANAIISFIASIGLLTNVFAQFFTASFMLTMIAILMIASGFELVFKAFRIKKFVKKKAIWIIALIAGILMAIAGIMSLINPIALALTIGVMVGVDIMMAGLVIIFISVIAD